MAVSSSSISGNTNNFSNKWRSREEKLAWIQAAGITETDHATIDILVGRESSWNPLAVNKESGACSLAQSLPCSKIGGNWKDPAVSLRWMNQYIKQRYGTWQNALAFHYKNNWY